MDVITNTNTYKYKCEKLNYDLDEYKFVKNFYKTINITSTASDNVKVYKILENKPTKILEEKRNNLMLFHGTSETNIDGILKKGFINSKRGRFGQGVYMTESANIASIHSLKIANSNTCILVNEVLESEKLEIIKYKLFNLKTDAKPDHRFEKHEFMASNTATYKKDALGRMYREVANDRSGIISLDVYLADESLVVPRYLIVVSSEELVIEDLD